MKPRKIIIYYNLEFIVIHYWSNETKIFDDYMEVIPLEYNYREVLVYKVSLLWEISILEMPCKMVQDM